LNPITPKRFTAGELATGILSGNRLSLSKAITLVESSKEQHNAEAQEVIKRILPHSGKSMRIGITGVPGVGKSTFIEAFGMHCIEKGHKVAVLAVDPSSQRTGGSILGDKTRMEILSKSDQAFIRPSPSAGSLGGVARKTRETIFLCEAFGFDIILVETVGVGQSETQVHSMVDFFLLLMLAGAGDELQGIKRGIMEMADMVVINKADGSNLPNALRAKAEYSSALHLFPPKESGWYPLTLTASALHNEGIIKIIESIEEYRIKVESSGFYISNRINQIERWFDESLTESVLSQFFQIPHKKKLIKESKEKVKAGSLPLFEAIQNLLKD